MLVQTQTGSALFIDSSQQILSEGGLDAQIGTDLMSAVKFCCATVQSKRLVLLSIQTSRTSTRETHFG